VSLLCGGGWIAFTSLHIYLYAKMMKFRKGLPQSLRPVDRFFAFVARPGPENWSARSYGEPGRKYVPWLVWSGVLAWGMMACVIFSVFS